ncbi:MAG: major tail protein [Candidatus Onthovivens sp.]|nr:major tail protein [Candidatus Onthovivens sp.]
MEYNEYRGVRGLVIAEIETDNGTYKAKPWQKLSGAQSVALSTTESSETHYYDNLPGIVVNSEGADEITLTISVLDLKTRALVEGRTYDQGADMLVKTPKKPKLFALGFIGEKTNGVEEFNILYKGSFTGGNTTHNTKDDGTEGTNVEYTFTAIYTTSNIANGEPAKSVIVSKGDKVTEEKVFGTFTEDVSSVAPLTPTEIKALITA